MHCCAAVAAWRRHSKLQIHIIYMKYNSHSAFDSSHSQRFEWPKSKALHWIRSAERAFRFGRSFLLDRREPNWLPFKVNCVFFSNTKEFRKRWTVKQMAVKLMPTRFHFIHYSVSPFRIPCSNPFDLNLVNLTASRLKTYQFYDYYSNSIWIRTAT